MAALERTPVFPEATPEGAVSAHLRRQAVPLPPSPWTVDCEMERPEFLQRPEMAEAEEDRARRAPGRRPRPGTSSLWRALD